MQEPVQRDRASPQGMTSQRGIASLDGKRPRYARLMQVDIRHEYYGEGHIYGPCPDFTAFPTPPTQAFMKSLGLLFMAEPTGFSVVYDVRNTEGLCRYLRAHGVPLEAGAADQYWTRLSFLLSLDNPYFLNFTDMPVSTNPSEENYYFTNQQAHRSDGEVILNEGERVDSAALLPVEGPEVKVGTPEDVERVVVRDIAGVPVLVEPRCVPVSASPPAEVCRSTVFLNFRTLVEDKYVIDTVAETITLSRPMLYTVAEPNPLCFIDLLFSRPTETADGVYPVDLDPADPSGSIQPVHYVLRFKARSTYWRYYIVPAPQREELEDLVIETVGERLQVPFSGPTRAVLPTGARAYLFVSEEPLLLQQHSTYRFRLNGWVKRSLPTGDPLIARMPVAAGTQILPEGDNADGEPIYSDIYVYV